MARAATILAVALVLISVLGFSSAFLDESHPAELRGIPGVDQDAAGNYFLDHEGVRWLLAVEPQLNKVFFFNSETQEAQWEDPRQRDVTAEIPEPPTATKTSQGTGRILVVAVLPMICLVGALVGRIYYLQTHYPELLWPTKERRHRQRQNQKFKPQKARGKMSQDGKGGRSANS